jgi:hypothetical protein
MDNFLFSYAELLALFPGSFGLNCGFYMHICLWRKKSPQKTYWDVYSLPSKQQKHQQDGLFLCSVKHRLCVLISDSFWTVRLRETVK